MKTNLFFPTGCFILIFWLTGLSQLMAQSCPPPPPPPPAPPPGFPPGDPSSSGAASATDPNQKVGPIGFGAENFLGPGTGLPYRVKFENFGPGSVDGNGASFPSHVWATAPAQEVEVSDVLSPAFDWSTFRFTSFGFGATMRALDPPRPSFQTILPLTINGRSFDLHFGASFDLSSGRLRAAFRSIDPGSSLPPDVLTGFLPPEDGTGAGQGFIEYTVEPRPGLTTGTQIRNVALISFDRQPAIATDQIDPLNAAAGSSPAKQALVTIDAGAPTSSVAPLASESGRAFDVQWFASDDAGGSGIASIDVFVATNEGPFSLWLQATNQGAAAFVGELGQTYSFMSRARDNVGNEEPIHLLADAFTTVSTNSPVLAAISNQTIRVGSLFTLTNMLTQAVPSGDYRFYIGRAPAGFSINLTNGVARWVPPCNYGSSTNPVVLWVTDQANTNLSDALTFSLIVGECLEPQLGTLILPVGERGRLPVNLITSEPLTNLTVTVDLPAGRLIEPSVEIFEEATNVVGMAGIEAIADLLHLISLASATNTFMYGTQQVAWLYITAASNQPSAFLKVRLFDSVGTLPDGSMVTNLNEQVGRVIVVGDEPLLEGIIHTNRQPALVLYSLTGTTNLLESAAGLKQLEWQPYEQTVMTNLMQLYQPIAIPTNGVFFRAVKP